MSVHRIYSRDLILPAGNSLKKPKWLNRKQLLSSWGKVAEEKMCNYRKYTEGYPDDLPGRSATGSGVTDLRALTIDEIAFLDTSMSFAKSVIVIFNSSRDRF